MDIPLISRFGCGYAQGVKASERERDNHLGTSPEPPPAAWNDPVRGGEIARSQIAQGADVVLCCCGQTRALASSKLRPTRASSGSGVDANQNYLQPGSVLTSMLKRVDTAVYNAMMAGEDVETGVIEIGLAEDGVGYAVDEYNEELIYRGDGVGRRDGTGANHSGRNCRS